jgi:hypothetical protein
LKADPNIGKNPMFLNAAGMFDLANLKNTSGSCASNKDRDSMMP